MYHKFMSDVKFLSKKQYYLLLSNKKNIKVFEKNPMDLNKLINISMRVVENNYFNWQKQGVYIVWVDQGERSSRSNFTDFLLFSNHTLSSQFKTNISWKKRNLTVIKAKNSKYKVILDLLNNSEYGIKSLTFAILEINESYIPWTDQKLKEREKYWINQTKVRALK